MVSPVPPQSRSGLRLQGHHNPLEPFRLHRRGAYRQKQPEAMPRAVPDAVVEDLFGALDCNRDRALFAMFLSSGARAGELLGMTVGDAQPGDGRINVRSKGLGGGGFCYSTGSRWSVPSDAAVLVRVKQEQVERTN